VRPRTAHEALVWSQDTDKVPDGQALAMPATLVKVPFSRHAWKTAMATIGRTVIAFKVLPFADRSPLPMSPPFWQNSNGLPELWLGLFLFDDDGLSTQVPGFEDADKLVTNGHRISAGNIVTRRARGGVIGPAAERLHCVIVDR
jgi:hypothetical protein